MSPGKDQRVNVLSFADHQVAVTISQLCCCSINKWEWLCSNKTILMDTESWILYNFQISRSIMLLLTFFQQLKNVKHRQWARFGPWTVAYRPLWLDKKSKSMKRRLKILI